MIIINKMEAKELRIGNYVNYVNQKVNVLQISVEGRNKWDVELGYFEDSIGFERLFNEIQPIPLTEEWLLKFGATKTPYEDDSNDYYCVIRHDNFNVFHEEGFAYLDICEVIIKLEYVHKLQNIWYALTGEELTIKE
jgi:hypothetical protein